MTSRMNPVRTERGTGSTTPTLGIVLPGLMMGMLLAALDLTIVTTAARAIADDLGGFSSQAWVTTGYLITSTVMTPVYGKLAARFGDKRVFATAISIFIAGSLACSWSTSMTQLAAFRAVQGIGGGGLMSMALIIVARLVSGRERARYQGYFLAAFGLAGLAGPIVGGIVSDQSAIFGLPGWRWIFLINVPIGLVSMLMVTTKLRAPVTRSTPRPRIDAPGAAALAVTLVPLLLLSQEGRGWGWRDLRSIGVAIIASCGLVGFILIERTAGPHALLPLATFRVRGFTLGVLLVAGTGAVMFASVALLPQYFQVVHSASPASAGLQLLPLVGAMTFGAIESGRRIHRTGHYRGIVAVGIALVTAGCVGVAITTPSTPMPAFLAVTALLGAGLGFCIQPIALALQNILPLNQIEIATTSGSLFRQLGGTAGITVTLTALFSSIDARFADFRMTYPGTVPRGGADSGSFFESSMMSQLPTEIQQFAVNAFADAFSTVYFGLAAVAAATLLILAVWREVPLREATASDEAQ